MITEKALNGVASFLAWFLDLLPTFERPDWFDVVLTYWNGLGAIHHFGQVIPLAPIATAGAALVSATVLCTAISGSRVVLSMFTGGGGAK